jgi:hypothetical protein
VVTSTWGGVRAMAVRWLDGVSPVRTSTRISGRKAPRARISCSGPCRFFCTSFESARRGETYSTCVWSGGAGCWRKSESSAERNAASVLPEPVGAAMSVCRPAWMAGQPSSCGGVGLPKRSTNQSRTAGWK